MPRFHWTWLSRDTLSELARVYEQIKAITLVKTAATKHDGYK